VHRLSPGTQLATWRVEAWQGQGAYGAVYRAVHMGQEQLGFGALKLALSPWDARLMREAELLSRVCHPSIPRLLDRGFLRDASGAQYPFFIMEWVEGMPLYVWAQQHAPSCRQLCQVLAGLARALEALHAAGAVHRDVKGDNVLVRLSDRLPVLIDLGSGHFQGAERLTWQSLAPFTPEYLSPQACLFDIRLARNRNSYYPPSAADDLFALGVTAYRLVMGEYPPPVDAQQDEEGSWHVSLPEPRPLLERNPRIELRLREVILQLLSEAPEARGTATQVAEALEAAADESVPEPLPAPSPAAEVVVPLSVPARAGGSQRLVRPRPQVPVRVRKPWLALAAAGVFVVLLWNWRPGSWFADSQVPDESTSAVGSSATIESQDSKPRPSEKRPLTQESPPAPRAGQARPDEKGRCPVRKQVAINGGCWLEFSSMTAEECTDSGGAPFKGRCYIPAPMPPRKTQPTSQPAPASE
jgi:serine/threonine protein kinase